MWGTFERFLRVLWLLVRSLSSKVLRPPCENSTILGMGALKDANLRKPKFSLFFKKINASQCDLYFFHAINPLCRLCRLLEKST